MDERRFRHTPLKPKQHPPARNLVDPFVIAAPVHTAHSSHAKPQAHPQTHSQTHHRPHAAPHKPAAHAHAPVRSIDGFMPLAPPHKPAAHPRPVKPQARPFAAGPLHLKYQQPHKPTHPNAVHAKPQIQPLRPHPRLQPQPESRPRPQPAKPVKHIEPIPSKPFAVPPDLEFEAAQLEGKSEEEIIKKITQPLPAKPSAKARAKKAIKLSGWALFGLIVIGGLSLFSQAIGQAALAVYAIVALWRRWPSQQTFALALMMFVGIIVASSLSSVTAIPALNNITQTPAFEDIGRNLAVYAFLLLCIGTLALAREVRQDSRQDIPKKAHHA